MYQLAKYQWFRRLYGGFWLCSRSCGWFPVDVHTYVRHAAVPNMLITAAEDHSQDSTLALGITAGVMLVVVVLFVALVTGVAQV